MMNILDTLQDYPELSDLIEEYTTLPNILKANDDPLSSSTLRKIFSLIDLTTLDVTDNYDKVFKLCNKVNRFKDKYPDIPEIAAVCIYPAFVKTAKETLLNDKIKIASVVGGFPASQTFIEIKALEAAMAVKNGASEADMVISVGKLLSGSYEEVFEEITIIKTALGEAHLKVILETGALSDDQIYKASLIAMEAGADFIKTSTGKFNPPATLNAVYIMCLSINEFYKRTYIKTGIKPAGGISTSSEAFQYYKIIKEILGEEWLDNKFFRIGASRLANNIINDICANDGKNNDGDFF